jgi:hypothetical protein
VSASAPGAGVRKIVGVSRNESADLVTRVGLKTAYRTIL